MSLPLAISKTLVIPARDLTWEASRAAGPGGQNVNKVASKVALRFDLLGTVVLDEEAKARLRALSGVRLDRQGRLLVVSQATRDQGRNLEDARRKLALLVERALRRKRVRMATAPNLAAVEGRLAEKRHLSRRKRSRRLSVMDEAG